MSSILSGGGGAVWFEAEQGHNYQVRCEYQGGKVRGWIHDKTTDQIVGKEVWIGTTPKGLEEQRKRISERDQQAKEGDPEAQLQLYYRNPDSPDGLKWLCRSADQGHPHAQNEIACLYWKGGRGVKQDLARAYVWYSLAVRNGHEEYKWKLEKVAASLTPEHTAKAEEMLDKWQPGQCERDLVPDSSGN